MQFVKVDLIWHVRKRVSRPVECAKARRTKVKDGCTNIVSSNVMDSLLYRTCL